MSQIKKNIVTRFAAIYILVSLGFAAVIGKVIYIQYVEGDRWREVGKKNKKEDIIVYADRGNIYSSEGKLMASSIPYYKLFMDLSVLPLEKDTLMYKHIDSLSICLSKKLKNKSAQQYKSDILNAYHKKNNKGKRNTRYVLYPNEVSYIDLQEIKKFPLFRLGMYKSGFYTENRVARVRPFGSLAARTIGSVYASSGKGHSGLEQYCDSILTGRNGICTRQKVAGERIAINEVDPVDGIDIITTINIDMQDIAEKALREKLRDLNAEEGCAVVMDVKSGEIKAIANLVQGENERYYETRNVAFGTVTEPGSTFKIASMIVALEEGVVKPTDTINTFNGMFKFGSTPMYDHNYHRGGYQVLTAAEAIQYSSNIGIARIINEKFKDKPEVFINKLYSMGLNEKISMEIPGSGYPMIPHPKNENEWSKGDKTKLPWLSIGYNTEMPPIYTLMLYNAIANNGKMIKPFFVKGHSRNGEVIKKFSTETINPSICSTSTLNEVKKMLEAVVENGTAKNVASSTFKIAGKTGTAQQNYGSKDKKLKHQVSFCGYFPADEPVYSCIVVIIGPKAGYVSAGQMAGSVFKEVAEKIYARDVKLPVQSIIVDSTLLKTPITKDGNYNALKTVFNAFNINATGDDLNNGWVNTNANPNGVSVRGMLADKSVPNVVNMGAKDAVYLLENLGMKVKLEGVGTVKEQSVPAGRIPTKGELIVLKLK